MFAGACVIPSPRNFSPSLSVRVGHKPGHASGPSLQTAIQAAWTRKAPEKDDPVGVALWSFSDMEEKVRSCETLRLQPCSVKHPPGEWTLLLVLETQRWFLTINSQSPQ